VLLSEYRCTTYGLREHNPKYRMYSTIPRYDVSLQARGFEALFLILDMAELKLTMFQSETLGKLPLAKATRDYLKC
jgi:hypothetical protein